MITKQTFMGFLFGCTILLMTESVAMATNVIILSANDLWNKPFYFTIHDARNIDVCHGAGIKLSGHTNPVNCPALDQIKTPQKLKIEIGPNTTTNCAPNNKPIEFQFDATKNKSIVIRPMSTFQCIVVAQ